MSKFDTHGGYFAPAGYMKVNEGGKHEENPNGGVQVGMDQSGTPNLLEEGEPVYKDFVFSDNIKANKKVLEQLGIPAKYAGKLYSEIADAFLSEAEERPNDAISANGLNAMLDRLAEAQEEQKRQEEETALMKELAKLPPEELAELEATMAQEQQAEQIPMEQIAPEQMQPEMMQPEMPMMACGGKMNKFDGGGRKGNMSKLLDGLYRLEGLIGNALRRPGIPSSLEGFSPFGLSYGPMYLLKSPEGAAESSLDAYVVPGSATGGGGRWPEVIEDETIDSIAKEPSGTAGIQSPKTPTSTIVRTDWTTDKLPAIIGKTAGIVAPEPKMSPLDVEIEKRLGPEYLAEQDIKHYVNSGNERQGYPTWPRYAGAVGSGLLALQNLMQKPDHYEYTPIRPVLPYGNINLQDERYMPVDMNMLSNAIQSQSQANVRSLRNSGLGPSLAAAQLAADYNATQNLGAGLLQGWQANNQERNRVISANNANEVQRANFYATLDQARANAMNQAKYQNLQNRLYVDRLNKAAEAERYAAISQNLDNALSALSDIGYENINRNMVDGNTALLYALDPRFNPYYKNGQMSCGGSLLKKYKK